MNNALSPSHPQDSTPAPDASLRLSEALERMRQFDALRKQTGCTAHEVAYYRARHDCNYQISILQRDAARREWGTR
jgi:hypothetical protein